MTTIIAKNSNWRRASMIIVPTFAVALALCNAGAQLESPVHYVSTNGSNTYPYDTWPTAARGVQTAINAAEPGDTVLIGPGTFDGAITTKNNVTIQGMGQASTTIRVNTGLGLGACAVHVIATNKTLDLTIMSTSAPSAHGVTVDGSGQLEIANCEIAGFNGYDFGNGGTYVSGLNIDAPNCKVSNCYVHDNVSGVNITGAGQNTTIENTWADSCSNTGIYSGSWGNQLFDCIASRCGTGIASGGHFFALNCLVCSNQTGISLGYGALRNCTIANNQTGYYENVCGGCFCALDIRNCIIVRNIGIGINANQDNGPLVDYNCVWNNGLDYENCHPGPHALSENPRFVGSTYRLSCVAAGQSYDSPCIDAGDSVIPDSLLGWTTRTDNVPDTGVVDLGFHYPVMASAPAVTQQPLGRTNVLGSKATFCVSAGGTPPLSYRWRFNGTNLVDGGRISGAATNLLTISNVQNNDAGGYTVVVTNTYGSVTSWPPALLTVGSGFITGSCTRSNGTFHCTLGSVPGLRFEIQSSTNLSRTNWTVVGVLTNLTGTVGFTDSVTHPGSRFYRARQLP